MPRIYIQRSDDLDGDGCEAVDFCKSCWVDVVVHRDVDTLIESSKCPEKHCEDSMKYVPLGGDNHPEYSDFDYDCYRCDSKLTSEDD